MWGVRGFKIGHTADKNLTSIYRDKLIESDGWLGGEEGGTPVDTVDSNRMSRPIVLAP